MLDEEQQHKRIYGTDNTIGLFVSLYLIVLAFFLVLTSMSQQVLDRAADVAENMYQTFGDKGERGEEDFEAFGSEFDPPDDDILKSIAEAFETEFDLIGLFGDADGRFFAIDLPETYLFEPGAGTLRSQPGLFLRSLANLTSTVGADRRLEISLLQNTIDDDGTAVANRRASLAFRRGSALATSLHGVGGNAGKITVGLAPMASGMVRFIFRSTASHDTSIRLGIEG